LSECLTRVEATRLSSCPSSRRRYALRAFIEEEVVTKTASLFAALLAAGVLTLVVPSDARELREPQAHMLVDVPDDWNVDVDGRYQRAEPPDHSFHLRILSSDHGMHGEQDGEQFMLGILREKFSNIQVDRHARRNDWGNYHSYEIFGHGNEESGNPGKFFVLFAVDGFNDRHGMVMMGTGPNDGFDRHQQGIYDATHRIRAW
jgi:hypothetical protein